MTLTDAQELLDDAIEWKGKRWPVPHPERLYAVYEGVVYRATPTVPGKSYHGFPEHPDRFPRGAGAKQLRCAILSRARERGC